MSNEVGELARVMEAEIELGDALMEVMSQKRSSIVTIRSDRILSLAQREEELLVPFGELEQERLRLCSQIVHGEGQGSGRPPSAPTVEEVLTHIPAPDAVRIATLAHRLRTVVERIQQVNDQNRVYMQRSLRFVQETLRLATEDHTRQLVDQRL